MESFKMHLELEHVLPPARPGHKIGLEWKEEDQNNISTSDEDTINGETLQILEDTMMEAKDRERWRAF